MNTYPPPIPPQHGSSQLQQAQGQYPARPPSSQQHPSMSFPGGGMGMNMNMNVNMGGGIAMNPGGNMMNFGGMNMNTMNMNQGGGAMGAMGAINPSFLAHFQSAQNNAMVAKFPYNSYQNANGSSNQGLPQSQPINSSQMASISPSQTMSPSQMTSINPSQMHSHSTLSQPPQTPTSNPGQNQSQGQSISPSQLMSPQMSSNSAGGPSLTLTPAQLLQQQQGGVGVSMDPASMSGGTMNPNMGSMGGINPSMNSAGMNLGNMGGMGGMNPGNMGAMGMPNVNQPMNMRMGITPQQWAQMSPQERSMLTRQQQAMAAAAAGLLGAKQQGLGGHQPGTALLGHGHAPSHERPQHERTPSLGQGQGYERGQSQSQERGPGQNQERAPSRGQSQPHDRGHSQAPANAGQESQQQQERPSSSASARSHHSQNIMPPPPNSRPGTAGGTMDPRMNPLMIGDPRMNTNPHMNADPRMNTDPWMNSDSRMSIDPRMNPASHSMNPDPRTSSASHNMGANVNSRANGSSGSMNLNPHMNPSNLNPHMNNMNINPHMNISPQMNPNVNPQLGAAPGGSINPHMNTNVNQQMNRPPTRPGSAQQHVRHSSQPAGGQVSPKDSPRLGGGMNLSAGGGMGMGMGSMNMNGVMGGVSGANLNVPGLGSGAGMQVGLGAGGSMLGGAGGGLMGPPVIPQSVQERQRMEQMQALGRERSGSVHAREQGINLQPNPSAPFMQSGLDHAGVPNLTGVSGGLAGGAGGPSAVMGRQSSLPPVPPHQQSPARSLVPPHRSPMPPIRKVGEVPGTGLGDASGLGGLGSAQTQKLPPHLAALNPAVTKISFIPYTVPPKVKEEGDGTGSSTEDDKNAVTGSSSANGTSAANGTTTPAIAIEDPVPLLTDDEIATLKNVKARDAAYEAAYRQKLARMGTELKTSGVMRGAWWERDFSAGLGITRRPERFDVRYPRPRVEPGSSGASSRRKGVKREGIRVPRKIPPEQANRPEQLVPIRLEFDVEHHKMRDTFVWNLNDPVITPELFAQSVVEDYALAPSYHSVITKSIQEQLSDYKAHATSVEEWEPAPTTDADANQAGGRKAEESENDAHDADISDGEREDVGRNIKEEDHHIVGRGLLDHETTQWWESWRKRIRPEGTPASGALGRKGRKRRKVASARSVKVEEGESELDPLRTIDNVGADDKSMQGDLRILIKLDIIVGSMKLDDQFEWDLENVDASPEQFAEVYAKELGLGGEFKTAISHCIREQVQIYQKSLFLVGHPTDGSLVQDDDLRMSFLPSLTTGARAMDQVPSFTPLLNYLSDGEIERSEKEREKELTKRRKRNTRGRRGIALPDREPNRTYRTPAIGFPELDPAALALAVAANAPTSRRAAAAAASLTIANMVASENGTSVMPLQLPQQQATSSAALLTGKEKKPKGLFKAPSYPPTVLRPRARITAPTPSTAADTTSLLPIPALESDPPSSYAPPDIKAAAKRARELEREAKEKEFADGQHANAINGIWHCSNCGCPESIAIGRRKGPLGDKSQCGTCGKFWHRHRRPRPVQYNSDPEYHINLQREVEQAKTGGRRRGRPQNPQNAPDGSDTPSRQRPEVWVEVPSRPPNSSTALPSEDDRAVSPASTSSSGSEAPLASLIATSAQAATTGPPHQPPISSAGSPKLTGDNRAPSPADSNTASPSNITYSHPQWLITAVRTLQAKYRDDKFEAILRRPSSKAPAEWRIKCLDCPGKLYNSGPGDTLSNYEVHLKNRQHRQRVNTRLNGG
ncbi:SNF5-domain-containing protein [Leucogyrophana mollusca]|uniref:SNF5-domain-containing protein n=1 Tax=Leucogyrophana mollusca TaxID=85980 RepID=A0ACB8BSD2_9AGAM|nr:SNF5-domain-containing protein [Leucogyrophana mollusca]